MESKNKLSRNQILKSEFKNLLNLYTSKQLDVAESKARKLIKIFPNESILYNLIGLILTEKREIKHAIVFFEKAIRIKPDFGMVYNNLANIYKNQGKIDKAVNFYKKAIDLSPKSPEPHNNLGNLYKTINNLPESIKSYKRAIKINPKLFIVHNNLGTAYKILGIFDKAKFCFQEAIRIKPDFYFSHRNLSLIRKFVKNDQSIIKLKKAFTNIKNDAVQKRELAFALGKMCEDIEEYDESIKYFIEGNRIERNSFNYSSNDVKKLFNQIISTFNKTLLQNNKIKINLKKIKNIPIFIVGMPRSGTTLIEQILSNHSKIFGAGETEILDKLIGNNIYKNNVFNLDRSFLDIAGAKYIDDLKKISDKSIFITDKLPFNFRWIGLIKLILPNAKIPIKANNDH